tara:strand:+ start:375 stop:608 length:234 start_codon:yes stop_codon:yes gene_type:complete
VYSIYKTKKGSKRVKKILLGMYKKQTDNNGSISMLQVARDLGESREDIVTATKQLVLDGDVLVCRFLGKRFLKLNKK